MRDLSCAACVELCPDVGLGAAGAEDRAAVLAHVERCATCAATLRAMTDLGDGLCGLIAPIEPPHGFERRVLAGIRDAVPPDARPTLVQRLRARPLAVAAAVVVAVALALGGWAVGQTTSAPASAVVTAALVSHDQSAGKVVLVPGPHPWISMTVNLATSSAVVRCQVRDRAGRIVTLGTFSLDGGYGSWASPLPAGLMVKGARLTTPGGRVLASASLR